MAVIWKCRRCGAESERPDSVLVLNPATASGYRAPCCGPCGQYFSAEDLAAIEAQDPAALLIEPVD